MKSRLLLFSLLLLSQFVFCQQKMTTNYQKTPLDEVLRDVEKVFAIVISYNSKITENKTVDLVQSSLSLSEITIEIEKQTGLFFSQIDKDNYILSDVIAKNNGSICGVVYDAESKQPLENVSIIQLKTQRGTVTDEHGKFNLSNIPLQNLVQIQLLGYDSKQMIAKELSGENCRSIYLSETVFHLDEILIKDYLFSGFYKNKDGSIRTKPKEMQLLPGVTESDVMRSLQYISGIQSPDETATGLNVRGGTPDQNLILWDGIKIYRTDHLFGMISSLNPNVIEDVKVYKNASLARYSNHISGVIDIQSSTTIPAEVNAGFGTNMLFSDAFVKTPVGDNTALILSARKSLTDVVQTIAFDNIVAQVFQNSEIGTNNLEFSQFLSDTERKFNFYDFSAKVISKLGDDGELSVSSLLSQNIFDINDECQDIQRVTHEGIDILNAGVGLQWKQRWSPKFSTQTAFNYSHYDFKYEGNQTFFGTDAQFLLRTNKVNDITFQFQTEYQMANRQKWVNGYQFIYNKIDIGVGFTGFFDILRSQNNTHAVFSEYHYNHEKWNALLGVRANYFSVSSEFAFEPRFHISYSLNDSFSLQVGAEKQFQPLSQIVEFDISQFGSENRTWLLADDEFSFILESSQYSFGGSFHKNEWYLSMETYVKNIQNISSFFNDIDADAGDFFTGDSRVLGLDLLAKKRYYNYTSLLSYSLSKNDFFFDDLNNGASFPSTIDVRHNLAFVQTARINDFELSLAWKFRTSTPFTPANGLVIDPDDPFSPTIDFGELNSGRLPSYHRMDFSGKYHFKLFNSDENNAVIGLSLLNIYNRRNILNRSYRLIENPIDGSGELRELNRFSLERTPNVFFRLSF